MARIIPAILTDNRSQLRAMVGTLSRFSDWIQIDIADGEFVENKTVTVEALADLHTSALLEVHLMTEQPEQFFLACQRAGVRRVIFHLEAAEQPGKLLDQLDELGLEKGIAINPETPIELLLPYVERIDVALLLSVHPGWQGQNFLPQTIDRVRQFRSSYPMVIIEVDGGLNAETIGAVAQAGADYLVVGSAIVKADDPAEAYRRLSQQL